MFKSPKPAIPRDQLLATLPQTGRVEWIGLRPDRGVPMQEVNSVEVSPEGGLSGDRYGKEGGHRQVTLIQSEHLQAITEFLGREGTLQPARLRRNLVISGINLIALKERRFRIGTALLEGTGACAPCSKMEQELGPGGYNAMRGHGGITARVIEPGRIELGDEVTAVDPSLKDK